MADVVSKVEKGVASAQEANAAIVKIGEGSRSTVTMVDEITTSIREQATATNNIATLVERIAQMAEVSNGAASGSADAARELDELATSMHKIVETYKI